MEGGIAMKVLRSQGRMGCALPRSRGMAVSCLLGLRPGEGCALPRSRGMPFSRKERGGERGLLGVSRFAVWGVFSFDATGVILPPLLAYLVLPGEEYSPATYLREETYPVL